MLLIDQSSKQKTTGVRSHKLSPAANCFRCKSPRYFITGDSLLSTTTSHSQVNI